MDSNEKSNNIENNIIQIRKDADTIQKTVLTNIIKMIYNRKWITYDTMNKKIEEFSSSLNDNQLYKVSLDVKLLSYETYEPEMSKTKNFKDDEVVIKLVPQKVTSIGKSPILIDFIEEYKQNHKILVVESITEKQKQTLISNNRHLEIFNENFFMLDLLSFVCSPQYEVLTQTEIEQLLKTYNLTQKQVVRIIRNSEITGKSVDYRIVVHRG